MRTRDGLRVHGFQTLRPTLAPQARVTYRPGAAETTFTKFPSSTRLQQRTYA